MSVINRCTSALLVLLVSGLAFPAHALHPLATDDAATVEAGAFELELSADQVRDDDASFKATSLAVGLRHGLSPTVDIGLGTSWSHFDLGSSSGSGLSDSDLSLKWRFFEQGPLQLTLIPAITLPTGDEHDGLGSGEVSYGTTVAASWDLGADLNLHGNLGLSRENFDGGHDTPLFASMAVTGHVNSSWLLAAEAGATHYDGDANPAFATLAAVYSLSPASQVSFGYRFGLNDEHGDQLLTLGLTSTW